MVFPFLEECIKDLSFKIIQFKDNSEIDEFHQTIHILNISNPCQQLKYPRTNDLHNLTTSEIMLLCCLFPILDPRSQRAGSYKFGAVIVNGSQ